MSVLQFLFDVAAYRTGGLGYSLNTALHYAPRQIILVNGSPKTGTT